MVLNTSVFRFILMIGGILGLFDAVGWAQGTFQANEPAAAESPAVPIPLSGERTEKPAAAPVGTAPAASPENGDPSPAGPGSAKSSQPDTFDWEKKTLGQPNRRSLPTSDTQPDPGRMQTPSLWRTTLSLLAVLAVIGGGAYLFRRFAWSGGKYRGSRGIEVLARSVINPRQTLCLIKFGQRLVLVGVSPNHMAALDTVENPEEIAGILAGLEKEGPHSITNTFGSLLRRETREYSDGMPGIAAAAERDYAKDPNQQWYQARGELTNLLDKVKGLTRIHLHRKG